MSAFASSRLLLVHASMVCSLALSVSCGNKVQGAANDSGGDGGTGLGGAASGGNSAGGSEGSGGRPSSGGGSMGGAAASGGANGAGGSDGAGGAAVESDPCQTVIDQVNLGCAGLGDVNQTEGTSWTPGCRSYDSLTIGGSATVTFETTPDEGPSVIVANSITISAGATLSASGEGYGPGGGPGAGSTDADYGSGAGHGGKGGDRGSLVGGSAYGSAQYPVTAGSGGGAEPDASGGAGVGGPGGGALILCARETLTIDGTVEADGLIGYPKAGEGAGGSILMISPTIAGSGAVSAKGQDRGASCSFHGSGGGGGLIAFRSEAQMFIGTTDVSGGYESYGACAAIAGESGSVYYGGLD